MVFYLASQTKERKHTIGEFVNNGLFFVGERERIWTICFGIVVLSTLVESLLQDFWGCVGL